MVQATLDTAASVTRDANAVDLGCTVSVESFSGPLDLLLFLVRKSELDIIDIPIATIADQFVTLVAGWQQDEQLDLEMAGDFILMAATLLEIKARTIAPPPVADGEQVDTEADDLLDPRADLIGKLLAYRRFKEAAGLLMQAEAARSQSVLRQMREDIPEDPDEAAGIDLGELQVSELSKCWYTLLARIGGAGPRTVMRDDLPIEGSIRKLSTRAEAEQQLTLQQLFAGEPTLQGRVSMLMATLECTRQRIVRTTQVEQYGEISMQFRSAAERIIVPVQFPPEEGGKKRRRRPPLVTFTAPVAPSTDEQEDVPEVDEKHETDEERFLRELNEACDLDGVLARVHDVESGFQRYWEVLHPAPPPAVAAMPESPARASAPVVDVVVPVEPQSTGQVGAEIRSTSVLQSARAEADLRLVAESPASAAIQPVAEKALAIALPPAIRGHDEMASAPVSLEVAIAPGQPPEVQATESALPPAGGGAQDAANPLLVSEKAVAEASAAAPPEEAPAARSQMELLSEPLHQVNSAAPRSTAQEANPEPVDSCSDPVSLVTSAAPLVAVAVEGAQVPDTTADGVGSMAGMASLLVTASYLDHADAAIPSSGSGREPLVEVLLAEAAVPETAMPEPDEVAFSTVPAEVPRPGESPSSDPGCLQLGACESSPMPAAGSGLPPITTAAVAEVGEVERHPIVARECPTSVIAVPALVPQMSQPIALALDSTPEPVPEAMALTVRDSSAITAAVVAAKPIAVALPTTPQDAHQLAPVAPTGRKPPASSGFRARTLLLLLAGSTGAACAMWWSLQMASAETAAVAASGLSGPIAVPAPDAEVPLTATIRSPREALTDRVNSATSPLQAAIAPASRAGLLAVQVAPASALRERFLGGAEQWLAGQTLPIVVPWYACTELPVLPTGPASFSSEPRFDAVPVLAWARPESWAWCLQARALQPSQPLLPASAFIPDLELPDSLARWAQSASLAGVPVATFAQELGWTVLVRPAPVPQLDIWLGRR